MTLSYRGNLGYVLTKHNSIVYGKCRLPIDEKYNSILIDLFSVTNGP